MRGPSSPDSYHTVEPYLTVQGADRLLAFLKQAFDATETLRMVRPDGTVSHAEVRIGDTIIMLADAGDDCERLPCALHLYVNDMDATYARALRAGATPLMEPASQFSGERMAGVTDACGNIWWIISHVGDIFPLRFQRYAVAEMRQ